MDISLICCHILLQRPEEVVEAIRQFADLHRSDTVVTWITGDLGFKTFKYL